MTSRLAFAMNVNLPQKKLLKGFLKNKFKSMLTNQFVVFFKPHLFEFDNLAINIRLYAKVSLEKFFPFLVELRRLKLPE